MMTPPSAQATPRPSSVGQKLERWSRSLVHQALSGMTRGQLTIADAYGEAVLGQPDEGLSATLCIRDPRFYRNILLAGTDAVDDSFIQGGWETDDLTSLFRVMIRNIDSADRLSSWSATGARIASRLMHLRNANTRAGSRRNIQAHYDLGNEFFQLWLDETLAYSSGVFRTFDAPLREASEEKFDRVCRKLHLRSDDHLLEIGTGWGGFAMHAASRYGCRVTTTTISQRQYEVACERISAAGLDDRIDVLLCDYRDLTGQYDKLASIEMVEAVGSQFFDDYFRKCNDLLRPHGSFVIQAIVMPERRYRQYLKSVDFIQRYIFPGGCLPSVSAMLESVGRTGDFRLSHLEDFAPHYAETLRRWRETFFERIDQVRALGYSEEFIRMWTYYLCYCEAVFEERQVGVVQIHFDKPQCAGDPLMVGQRAAWQNPRDMERRSSCHA